VAWAPERNSGHQERKFVVVADDDRENEGDLICAVELVTTDMVNVMLRAKGMICSLLSLPASPPSAHAAARENTDAMRTAFCQHRRCAQWRDHGDQRVRSRDHHPWQADLTRTGRHRTPARTAPPWWRRAAARRPYRSAVDLCRLAGLMPAGVICEILDEDGHPMRRDALDRYASTHGLTFITVSDLVAHRLSTERLVHRVAEARLPTDIGGEDWRIFAYRNDVDDHEHVALTYGDLAAGDSVLVRMHSRCLTGDVFHSRRCDCGWQLHKAMEAIVAEGRGVIVYLDQEGRGIGLLNKLKAYELQDEGHDTVEANQKLGFAPDLRNYGIGAQILLDLGVRRIRVLTNNPKKLVGLGGYGLEIVDRVHLAAPTTDENAGYLDAKRDKLGHLLST
jgi:3,4-dihydroxy 2-butanone 4-phosphate synthase/GTP cyclohydrolase II